MMMDNHPRVLTSPSLRCSQRHIPGFPLGPNVIVLSRLLAWYHTPSGLLSQVPTTLLRLPRIMAHTDGLPLTVGSLLCAQPCTYPITSFQSHRHPNESAFSFCLYMKALRLPEVG